LALVFSFAVGAIPAHAGGWQIYHKTAKVKIDLQIQVPALPKEVTDLDCEKRLVVGIGEEVELVAASCGFAGCR
jgi:hypothetical protein